MQEYHYKSIRYTVDPDVYKPSEDTFLLAGILEKERLRGRVIEVGTGCALLSLILAQTADRIVATDISPYAVVNAQRNVKNNSFDEKIEVLRCDLASCLKPSSNFDDVIFNPPYLPLDQGEGGWLGRAWAGGPNGLDFTTRAIEEASGLLSDHGSLWFLVLGESQLARIRKLLEARRLSLRLLDSATFFYERLFAVKAEKER